MVHYISIQHVKTDNFDNPPFLYDVQHIKYGLQLYIHFEYLYLQ